MTRICIKWKSDKIDIDIDPNDGVAAFKDHIYKKTGVPVARQKLMCKNGWKGLLKDSVNLGECNLTDGQQVTLMGSSEGIPAASTASKVVFVEDMKAEEQAKHGARLPSGLVNLGNTCYMNSAVQCLRAVPELQQSLQSSQESSAGGSSFEGQLSNLFKDLERSGEYFSPDRFVSVLRANYPQYAERSSQGGFKQQDSEEFVSLILNVMARSLTNKPDSLPRLVGNDAAGTGTPNVVDTLFGVEEEIETNCEESGEGPVVSTSSDRKIRCNIQGGAGAAHQINHLHEGVKLGLEAEVEKHSDKLNRNAVWKQTSRLSRLPRYLCVQMMRFYWKATPNSNDHAGINCKMLRPVAFPADNFDVYDFCNNKVQKVLAAARDKYSKETLASSESGSASSSSVKKAKIESASAASVEDEELAKAIALSKGVHDTSDDNDISMGSTNDIGIGLPDNFRGLYELFAVVTHKGRSSSSGHYMGWVRQGSPGNSEKSASDDWLVFDDDQVSPCKTENVLTLKGGGDDHMAYLLFYRAKC